MADPNEPADVDVDDLPEMLPGETRAEWVERIRGLIEEPAPPVNARPYEPEEWVGVRAPFKEP